jgi:hypothetical protein
MKRVMRVTYIQRKFLGFFTKRSPAVMILHGADDAKPAMLGIPSGYLLQFAMENRWPTYRNRWFSELNSMMDLSMANC